MLPSESQSENAISCMILTIRYSGKGKTMETVKRLAVVRSWGGEGGIIAGAQRMFRAVKLFCVIL